MKAIIVSGGKSPSKNLLKQYVESGDYVIGVDKGIDVLHKYNIMPNMILGDFDSSNKDSLRYFERKGIQTLRYNEDKDYTDTHLAYIKAKEKGIKEILAFGATGTRLDHAFGNIGLLLNALEDSIDLKIIDDNNIVFLIDKKTTIKPVENKVLSFHSFSDITKGVTIRGAKYDLTDYDMKLLEPRAICNEFIGKDVTIDFKDGKILVLLTND